jgi:hypothetical protein
MGFQQNTSTAAPIWGLPGSSSKPEGAIRHINVSIIIVLCIEFYISSLVLWPQYIVICAVIEWVYVVGGNVQGGAETRVATIRVGQVTSRKFRVNNPKECGRGYDVVAVGSAKVLGISFKKKREREKKEAR